MKPSEEFIQKDYGKQSTFASFLPGIAGTHGIPIWCYYVNRGQAVVSFGASDKDHAIMEYYPAHTAYQNVKRTGFRTFLKHQNGLHECFMDENVPHQMTIHMNELELIEHNEAFGTETRVSYNILPGEKLGALMRSVTVQNLTAADMELELLDGMPCLIPYGVDHGTLKDMVQTGKAWMQVEDVTEGIPYYKVRASLADSTSVQEIKGGNFSFACTETGERPLPIVDPEAVFGYDNSLGDAVIFREGGLSAVYAVRQNTQNTLPASFYGTKTVLKPGKSITVYELIGQVSDKETLHTYLAQNLTPAYFKGKREEAGILADEICSGIATETANPVFDAYCKYTYLDNVLRGGYPMQLGSNKVFYVYSRKHGDLERDYNYFSMRNEFYSQGNGNFRDVNQNRRCDTFFAPFVERENIREFYGMLQLDGYNPLGIEMITYQLDSEKAVLLTGDLEAAQKKYLLEFLKTPFTPGSLYHALDECRLEEARRIKLFYNVIDFSEATVNGNFLEGYWTDHWTYNLDLIEEYLSVYPEKEQEMLFEEAYPYFLSQVNINRRSRRYAKTERGIRQYHALNEEGRRNTAEKLVRSHYGKGEILKVTLLEKLILLCCTKYAALDAYGMGIEMEGGKPGWYDALNGLPGMLGSSMAETYELARNLDYVIAALDRYPGEVILTKELAELMRALAQIQSREQQSMHNPGEMMSFWNQTNDVKEDYRDHVYQGVSGEKVKLSGYEIARALKSMRQMVAAGIEKAVHCGNGICPTYFYYEVTEYEEKEDGIHPVHMQQHQVPNFLEGPVRYMKLLKDQKEMKQLYHQVKESALYDEKLQMYKVNEPLEPVSFEVGRARAFTPGWLENESIWLHMEYKYLLEVLKGGLYTEFFEDFHHACVPFLDEKTYGRSVLENSSFIASSANPNPDIHGKGFVARLSGSTVEFISMWKLMMFGAHPFARKDGELACHLEPAIPAYLLDEALTLKTTLLGDIELIYQFDRIADYIPGQYQITDMELTYDNGNTVVQKGDCLTGRYAQDIRDRKVVSMTVNVCRKDD